MGRVVIAIIATILLCSCKTKYIAVPEYHNSIQIRTDTLSRYDSIYIHDSVYFSAREDTVYNIRYRIVEKYKYKDRVRNDTLVKTDSIPVPYPVERKLSKWEKIKMDIGGWAIGASVVMMIVILFISFSQFSELIKGKS